MSGNHADHQLHRGPPNNTDHPRSPGHLAGQGKTAPPKIIDLPLHLPFPIASPTPAFRCKISFSWHKSSFDIHPVLVYGLRHQHCSNSGQSVPKNVKSVLIAPYGRVASCQTPATSSPFSIWRHRRLGYTYLSITLGSELR